MAKLPRRVWSGVRKHRGKSDLWRYLLSNYDGLTKHGIGTPAGPSWHDVAAVLSEVGQKNREGGDLTGNAVRKVWAHVHAYVDKHGPEGRRKPMERGCACAAGAAPPCDATTATIDGTSDSRDRGRGAPYHGPLMRRASAAITRGAVGDLFRTRERACR